MKAQPTSIFNDVIGPVMTGPSSSHTAAPSRLGMMTRQLLSSDPVEIHIEFEKSGSFAASYNTQGTDRGLVGGLLGYKPENLKMLTAIADASEKGILVTFSISEFDAPHPNTARIRAIDKNGEQILTVGISTGGGAIEMLEINGFDVSMGGDFFEVLLLISQNQWEIDKARATAEEILGDIEYAHISEKRDQVQDQLPDQVQNQVQDQILLNFKRTREADGNQIQRLEEAFPGSWIRQIPPVFTILSRKNCQVPFQNGTEMEAWARENGYSPGEAGLYYEALRGNTSPDQILEEMMGIVDIMENSIQEALTDKRPGKLIKPRAADYLEASRQGRLVDIGAMDRIIAWTMAMVEVNSRYGIVVAAPTAGACGTVPGAILGTAKYLGATREEKALAMLAAGAVGIAIANQATFAAEICGCQAECGAASAIAAAGIIHLMGGTVEQSNGAASISLQNVLGMICDSVANLVEVPCLGRNVLGAVNALSSANMVMAGVDPVIPLDETIVSMLEVGKLMPPQLCCTNSGGLAITKASRELEKKLSHKK